MSYLVDIVYDICTINTYIHNPFLFCTRALLEAEKFTAIFEILDVKQVLIHQQLIGSFFVVFSFCLYRYANFHIYIFSLVLLFSFGDVRLSSLVINICAIGC